MINTSDKLLSTKDLADYLGVPVDTIAKWRVVGTGPPGIKVGKHVRYDMRDVSVWLDSRKDEGRS